MPHTPSSPSGTGYSQPPTPPSTAILLAFACHCGMHSYAADDAFMVNGKSLVNFPGESHNVTRMKKPGHCGRCGLAHNAPVPEAQREDPIRALIRERLGIY